MKAICKYSGIAIYKAPYLVGMDLADIHPIFRAKRKLILNADMVHKFTKAESSEEKKLIFLAVLYATELAEFRVVAKPSPAIVDANFYKLIHTASWLAFAEHTYKQIVGFPQFVISDDTADLTSLPAWIEACEDLKSQIIRKDIDRDRAAALSQRADEIKKELGEAWLLNRAFTPALARWAFEFAGMKKEDPRYTQWIKILCTKIDEVWVYDIDELKEILNYLENELPAEHPQVLSVMAQVRNLVAANRKGFTDFAVFNDSDPIGETFTILEDGEQPQVSKHLQDVPTDEPQRKDYPTSAAFLVAQAKYRLNLRAMENLQKQQETRKLVPMNKNQLTSEDV